MNKLTLNKEEELYNMILGGLIALASEKQVRKHFLNGTFFLGKWLKRVKNQKCYKKIIAQEIEYLLRLYSIKGTNSNLENHFYEIYNEFKVVKNISSQNECPDKDRFDLAMHTLSENGWHISLPITHNPMAGEPYRPDNKKEIFTTQWYWDKAFDENKTLIKELSIFVISASQKVIDCLYQHGFILIKGLSSVDEKGNYYHQYVLFPGNKATGDIAFPSEFKACSY